MLSLEPEQEALHGAEQLNAIEGFGCIGDDRERLQSTGQDRARCQEFGPESANAGNLAK